MIDKEILKFIAKERYIGTRQWVSPKFSPDGSTIYYLFGEEEDPSTLHLFAFDIAERTSKRLNLGGQADGGGELSLAEELRRERLRSPYKGVSEFRIHGDESAHLILLNTDGRFSLFDPQSERVTFEFSEEGVVDVKPLESLDRWVASTTDKILIFEVSTGATQVVAEAPAKHSLGIAEYICQEEFGRLSGLFSHYGSEVFVYAKVDHSPTPVFPIVNHAGGDVRLEEYHYPFVGSDNEKVDLILVGAAGEVKLELGEYEYIPHVAWVSESLLVVATLNRAQSLLRWIFIDQSGKVLSTVERSNEKWINVSPSLEVVDESSIAVIDEESGFGHVLVIGSNGDLKQLTDGEWVVSEILGVADGNVYFVGSPTDPRTRLICRVPLAGGAIEVLSSDRGLHAGVISPNGTHIVDLYSTKDQPVTTEVRKIGGETLFSFTSQVEDAPFSLDPPIEVEYTTKDGVKLYGQLYLPQGDTSGASIVVDVYGGPHAQLVTDTFGATKDLEAQYLRSQGIATLKVDNRGSANRGKAFEEWLFHRYGTYELDDQVEFLDHVIENYGFDRSKVGVTGWSYGGFMTLSLLLKRPDRFRVGVSGAPVTDFRFYDTGYTERYLGSDPNADSYVNSDVRPLITQLQSKLLVIHGLIDENVHVRNTLSLMQEATEKGVSFETFLIPNSRHMPRGEGLLMEIADRRLSFLVDNLQ
ncbi:MAG: prolyl oligopeptidase family serine peptidase [Actinomycetota bacterium]|nr:prolyl oligopeptidase family serine peptidase [Actinomycetota bacterium]